MTEQLAMSGQIDGQLVPVGADDDHVDELAEHLAEVGQALAAAKPDVVAEEHRAAAQVGHARLETHPGPQRRLLEQQGHDAAGQERLAEPPGELALQVLGDREDVVDLAGGKIGQSDEVSHGNSPGAGNCWDPRSMFSEMPGATAGLSSSGYWGLLTRTAGQASRGHPRSTNC